MNQVMWIILSVIVVSAISVIGIFFIFLKKEKLNSLLLFLVSLAAGSLLGGAFLHLIPEIIEGTGFTFSVSLLLLGGILLFFSIEHFIQWRHCHIPTSKSHPHSLGTMNIIGDGIHNFTDGILIGAAWMFSSEIGLATTLAIILHEIPQEISDFGILLRAGFLKRKALLFNFYAACTSIFGTILTLWAGNEVENISVYILPVAAGGFIYLASSSLLPEILKETTRRNYLVHLFFILLGLALMYLFSLHGGHHH